MHVVALNWCCFSFPISFYIIYVSVHMRHLYLQLIAISWVYGVDNFMEDIKIMLGRYPFPFYYWITVWKYLTPTSVFVSDLRHLCLKGLFNNSACVVVGERD